MARDGRIGRSIVFGMLALAAAARTASFIFSGVDGADIYFIIATGRRILSDGIVYANPFTAEQGLKLTVQQWAYCAACAFLYDSFGKMGLAAFLAAQYAAFMAASRACLKPYGTAWYVWPACATFAAACCHMYAFSIRPELLTVTLLLWECGALERLARGGRRAWAIVLPAGVILEMNFHAAMWPFHFCVLMAYCVPAFYMEGTRNGPSSGLWARRRTLVPAAAAMIPALFASPYGIDGVLYVIRSYAAGTFRYTGIAETRPIFDLPESFAVHRTVLVAVLALMAVAIAILLRVRALEGHVLNMALGFGLLSVMALRNWALLMLPLLFLTAALLEHARDRLDLDRTLSVMRIPGAVAACACAGCLLSIGNAASVIPDVASPTIDREYVLPGHYSVINAVGECVDRVLDDWGDRDGSPRVFTWLISGGYMEYSGFDHIYVDGRPEVYMAALNGSRNMIEEAYRYCHDEDGFADPEAAAWFRSYGWDYVVIYSDTSEEDLPGLRKWLYHGQDTGYSLAYEADGGYAALFVRDGVASGS